jgi:hypothetical protein
MNLTRSEVAAILSKSALAPRSKYGVSRKDQRTTGGITFDSKREMNYYRLLCQAKIAGTIKFFLRQTRFDLPGGVKYYADFTVFYSDGRVEFVDAKGMRTPVYVVKRKQVWEIYGVEIKEV